MPFSTGSSSIPIQVDSNQTLYAPGSTVIVELLYSEIGPAEVCELLDNGTVISSQLTVRTVENESCLMALSGAPSGAAQSLVLSSSMPATEESRVNIFLISSNTVPCSSSTESDRRSNVFSINSKSMTHLCLVLMCLVYSCARQLTLLFHFCFLAVLNKPTPGMCV